MTTPHISYEKLSKKFGVPASTIRNHSRAGGWKDKKAENEQNRLKKEIKAAEKEKVKKQKTALDSMQRSLLHILKDFEKKAESNSLSASELDSLPKIYKLTLQVFDIKGDLDMQEQLARIENIKRQANKVEW